MTPKFKKGDKVYLHQDLVTIASVRYALALGGTWQILYRIEGSPNEMRESLFTTKPTGYQKPAGSTIATDPVESDKYSSLTKVQLSKLYKEYTGEEPSPELKKAELLDIVKELDIVKNTIGEGEIIEKIEQIDDDE